MPNRRQTRRAPNFVTAFANESAFEAEQRLIAKAMDLPRSPKPEEPSTEELARAIGEGIVPGFSARRVAESLLIAAQPHIVSEHQGPIEELLITVPRDQDGITELNERHYSTLFAEMNCETKYLVVSHPDDRYRIEQIADASNVKADHLTFIDSPRVRYTIWAQDACE